MNKPVFIFDMNGVLLDFDIQKMQEMVSSATDIPLKEIEKSWKKEKYIQSETGEISSEEYYQYYSSLTGLSWSYEKWIQKWSEVITVNQSGKKLMRNLRKKYPVYILSNLAECHKIAVDRFDPEFWNLSTSNFLSYIMGIYKPDIRIYQRVCAKIGSKPEVCYYFDDVEENIESAKKLGIQAYHFNEFNMPHIESALQIYIKNC